MTEDKATLVRYLLGELTEEMEEQLERDYFLDQEKWHALRAAEDDLIHEYARGALSDRQRRQFESAFLGSPRNRERVEVARMLMDPAARRPPQPKGGWHRWTEWFWMMPRQPRLVLSVASLLVLAVVTVTAWVAVENRHLRADLRASSSQLQRAQDAPVLAESTAADIVIGKPLEAGLSRSSEAGNQPVTVPYSAAPVVYNFVLDLEQDEDPWYTATIATAEGKQLLTLKTLQSLPIANGKIIHLRVPSDKLAIGDYSIRLQGANRKTRFPDPYRFVVR